MNDSAVSSDVKAAFGVAMVLAFGASALDNGAVGWLVAPVVIGCSFYAMARAPIRSSMMVLMFLALTLENPSERPTDGQWVSPWVDLGALMLMHLKNTIGGGLFFSGLDLCLLWLGLVAWFRHSSGSRIDKIGNITGPRPLVKLAQLSLITMLFTFIVGQLRGGSDSAITLWQIDKVMYVPIVFLLFQIGIRGRADIRPLAKVVLWAAAERACEAMWVWYVVNLPPDPVTGEPGLAYATTHGDSMLFAAACVLLCSLVIQRVRGQKWLLICLPPILFGGMIVNNRRLVWVQLILVLVTVYVSTGQNATKRKVQRSLLFAAPVILLYGFIGWSASGGIFKPVKMIRSAVDSKTDGSTMWRDIENYDLIYTIKQYPFFGNGYGRPFIEVSTLPAVEYPLERYLPHNAVLGLWTFYGYFGFMGITALWVAGVYFSMLAYRRLPDPEGKAAALVCFGTVQIYWVQCYGDLGLGTGTGVYLIAPALAMGGKLAVASGAWVTKRPASNAGMRAQAS